MAIDIQEMNQEQARQLLEQFSLVNADEHIPGESVFQFRESKIEEYEDEGGVLRKRNTFYFREARINRYVPFEMYLQILDAQEKQKQGLEKSSPAASARWMMQQVLAVWRLTEDDMDVVRLQRGLSGPDMLRAFYDFFGAMLSMGPQLKAIVAGGTPPRAEDSAS